MKKVPSGVPGLDAILRGGFPHGRTMIVLGAAGSGKTVLAMQFLVGGASELNEPGLMISFEESPESLRANFAAMSAGANGVLDTRVHLVDGRPIEDTLDAGAFDLEGLIAIASALVAKHGVRRIAIDGLDALFARTDDAPHRRQELIRILNWLRASEITSILTIKDEAGSQRLPHTFDMAEYAADGVIHLRTKTVGELSRRTLFIIKIRGTGFDGGEHPYIIGSDGIRAQHAPNQTQASSENHERRLSTGVRRLDRMLVGGYRAGTTTLVSGLPGTAKTTLSAAFLEAGCLAGEPGLFFGFDEPATQMVIDVRSVGIDLQPHIDSGLLRVASFAAGTAIADEHFLTIERLLEEHRPKRMVIDPISALERAGGKEIASVVAERLVVMLKLRGVSGLFTVVAESNLGEMEAAPTRISTIADNWVHLSFANRGGERNRTLTIVKARGIEHSNQMRELLLSSEGIELADVYQSGGMVLFGSARAQREQQDLIEQATEAETFAFKLDELEQAADTLRRHLLLTERGLRENEARRNEIIKHSEALHRARDAAYTANQTLRRGDPSDG